MSAASDEAAAQVAEALRSMAPPSIVVGALPVHDRHVASLHPVEREAVSGAVATRRREHATGRALLRQLLGDRSAIAVGSSGAPVVPEGTRVSLAHDRALAVAAVSRSAAVSALGIDVEPERTLDEDEAAVILRPDEVDVDPLVAFVAKEATYKAWSSLGGPLLDFHEVRLTLGTGTFRGIVREGASTFDGTVTRAAGRWLALVVVPAQGPTGLLSRAVG